MMHNRPEKRVLFLLTITSMTTIAIAITVISLIIVIITTIIKLL